MLMRFAIAAAASALMAGAAAAQTTSGNDITAGDQSVNPAPQAAGPTAATGAATTSGATDTSGYNSRSAAGLGDESASPAGGAAIGATSEEGVGAPSPQIVTNGPVPDTPANRAKYGQPDSHGGRMTRPAGN
jgi:hypothetical protein